MRKNIKFVYRDAGVFDTSAIAETKEISLNIDPDRVSVMDCCKQITGEEGYFAFDEYYSNINLMCNENALPYIFRNGTVEWNIPMDKVSLTEFMDTVRLNDSDCIQFSYHMILGCGMAEMIPALLHWIKYFASYIGPAIDLIDAGKIMYQFFGCFVCIPNVNDVKEMLCRNNLSAEWFFREIIKDNDSISAALVDLGISESSPGKGAKLNRANKIFRENNEHRAVKIWGDPYHANEKLQAIPYGLVCINQYYTILKIMTYVDNIHYVSDPMQLIHHLIDKWAEVLISRKRDSYNLKFVWVKERKATKLSSRELIQLANDVDELSRHLGEMIKKVIKKENTKAREILIE